MTFDRTGDMLSDDDLRSLSRQELDDLRSRLAHAAGDIPSLTGRVPRSRPPARSTRGKPYLFSATSTASGWGLCH